MNEFEIKEIIKAFAFGFSAERVAEECRITVKEAKEIREKYAGEIKKKAGESYNG